MNYRREKMKLSEILEKQLDEYIKNNRWEYPLLCNEIYERVKYDIRKFLIEYFSNQNPYFEIYTHNGICDVCPLNNENIVSMGYLDLSSYQMCRNFFDSGQLLNEEKIKIQILEEIIACLKAQND